MPEDTSNQQQDMYMIGDLFLRHFYSVYDFDKDEVSLGVNAHSKGKVSMFNPSESRSQAQYSSLAHIDSLERYAPQLAKGFDFEEFMRATFG
mmetsp:Transcript_2201/g.3308  ORF Transcript_2201/g.3308 Transcript_2201/m.3308 type:complete len:92 (+) Transcript_2201:1896-2171(+)